MQLLFIDSPSSTSALTYTFEFNGNRARFNDNSDIKITNLTLSLWRLHNEYFIRK